MNLKVHVPLKIYFFTSSDRIVFKISKVVYFLLQIKQVRFRRNFLILKKFTPKQYISCCHKTILIICWKWLNLSVKYSSRCFSVFNFFDTLHEIHISIIYPRDLHKNKHTQTNTHSQEVNKLNIMKHYRLRLLTFSHQFYRYYKSVILTLAMWLVLTTLCVKYISFVYLC